MGEAEERLTRLGKKRAITKYLSDSSIFFWTATQKADLEQQIKDMSERINEEESNSQELNKKKK